MPALMVESYPGPVDGVAAWPRGGAHAAAAPEILGNILLPQANLAIWHRDLPAGLEAGLRPMLAAAPFTAVVEGPVDAAVMGLVRRLPADPPLDLLLDLQDLATLFAAIADTDGAVRLRLEAITGRACHRWHADAVGLRLLSTYCGPGTQWLALAGGAAAARELGPEAPLGDAPLQMPTGAVAILKGEGYPGNAGWGCIHRSPPAGPGSQARLLLCLDEPGRIPPE